MSFYLHTNEFLSDFIKEQLLCINAGTFNFGILKPKALSCFFFNENLKLNFITINVEKKNEKKKMKKPLSMSLLC